MTEVGWRFDARNPGGETTLLGFTITGAMSFDSGREVPKVLTGFTLIPSEASKVNVYQDQVLAFLLIDGTEHPMGVFNFNEDTRQKDVVLDNTTVTDLIMVGLGDECLRLIRNDGSAQSLSTGFDPAIAMEALLFDAGMLHSIAGADSISATPITWDGNTTVLAKCRELGELAGHRPLWADNNGIIRSVSAGIITDDVIELESLTPTAGSIAVTNNYLSAPNRVIVSDNSYPTAPLVGVWDAPSSAPHSMANRGYVLSRVVQQQGLGSSDHAQQVAETIGERYTARLLSAIILPTATLDGPVVISYAGVNWLVKSWSLGTDPGAVMQISAEELIGVEA